MHESSWFGWTCPLLFFSGKAVPTGILSQKVEILGFSTRCSGQMSASSYPDVLFLQLRLIFVVVSPRMANYLVDYIFSNIWNLFQSPGIKIILHYLLTEKTEN